MPVLRVSMNGIWVTTTNPHRQRTWQHLFGQTRLPVKTAVPRWQHLPRRPDAVLAYDLDLDRLHPAQVERLAAYIARRANWPYHAALSELRQTGFPIEAWQTEKETAVSEDDTAVLFKREPINMWSVAF